MAKKDLDAPELFINRELSWLEFNDRVLRLGLQKDLPLLERLKFLAIVSSNLDEFFMIRVAGLMQQRSAGLRRRDPAGLTPVQQLARISERAHRMVAEQADAIEAALTALAKAGLRVTRREEWSPEQRRFLRSYFNREVLPVLTPMAVEELDPSPVLPGLQLNVALIVRAGKGESFRDKIVVVPVPTQFARFVTMPAERSVHLARLEDIIIANAGALLPGGHVRGAAAFRITRDADVAIQEDEAGDLLQAVSEAVTSRRRGACVRLEISARPEKRLRNWLVNWLKVRPADIYEIPGLLDATALFEVASRSGFDSLKLPDWPPQPSAALDPHDDLWQQLRNHDVLLIHPYESFDPVVRLVESAAEDPSVLAIKQTLYRTSGDSPIVRALESAALTGKEVTVLVELKARFDEARNVVWARRLEDAGCHVIYGIAGLKTHAKVLLIVRREGGRIRRYVHLGTGNYNDKTARLYSDVGLMTCDRDIANDAAALFNLLTGFSEAVGWSKLVIAPTHLRRRLLELIDREIQASTREQPGLIMAKMNSLQDPGICKALYQASRAGVRVLLNVRGICCLRPGVRKVSEGIEVHSIVDRYLEHARVFYFQNGGHEEVYLSSADCMGRNLDRRLETFFPISAPAPRRRLIDMLQTCMEDNVQASLLHSDGTWERLSPGEDNAVRAQERFHEEAAQAVLASRRRVTRFRPLTRPKE
jgi:polyphosphate kinase